MASVNELNFNQVSTLLTSIVKQATGQSVLTPTTTSDFVSVATTALKNGPCYVSNNANGFTYYIFD